MGNPAPMLDYGAPREVRQKRGIVWIILALPLLVIPFVPFACDTSPAGVIYKASYDNLNGKGLDTETFALVVLAVNLCLGALTFIWRVRARWATSSTERVICVCFGIAGLLMTLVMLGILAPELSAVIEWVAFLIALLLLAMTAGLLVLLRRRRRGDSLALAAMLGPFVSCGIFALIELYSDRAIGWYLAAFSVPISILEMIRLPFARQESRQKETAGTNAPAVLLDAQ